MSSFFKYVYDWSKQIVIECHSSNKFLQGYSDFLRRNLRRLSTNKLSVPAGRDGPGYRDEKISTLVIE